MGATSWRYYTPFRPDPAAALQALRKDVFARGEYVDMTGNMEDRLRAMYKRFGEDPDSPAVRARMNEALRLQHAIDTGDVTKLPATERGFVRNVRWFSKLARLFGASTVGPLRQGKPHTIDELLEMAEESGTHSVLDIEDVAQRPRVGSAAPLKPKTVRKVFGTSEPTHEQVEQNWAEVAEPLGRIHCRYVVVYRDGQPHEYAFIGCSGD